MRALVIVLGDLERSPRMVRHAESLLRAGFEVELAGFAGAEPVADSRMRIRRVPSFDRLRGTRATTFLAAALLRQIALTIALALRLATVRRPRVVLVQNPPAFPALPVVLLFASFWRARVIVDWHNITAAMLRLRPLAKFVRTAVARLELAFARRADAHFAVSQAMADAIADGLRVRAAIVPDHAPASFMPGGEQAPSPVRRVIVPMSWSSDDDLALLTDAARRCTVPLVIQLTGDGERRVEYERRLASLHLEHVTFRTGWIAARDFPRVLASADLGLSIHRSASGVDLPVKIAEMLACGVPVCALDYGPVLREQLREGEDALFFSDADELAAIFDGLGNPDFERLRRSTRAIARPRWEEEWVRTAWPVIESAIA